MKSAKQKKPQTRQTARKFSKTGAHARIDALLSRPSLGGSKAAALVQRWRVLLAYLKDGNDANLPLESITRTELESTITAVAGAFERWDSSFFSEVAKAMERSASVKPLDWQAIAIEQAIVAGLTSPTEIAMRLTDGRSRASLDSTRRQVTRYLNRISPDK